jgi:hypothetical protein
MTTLTARSPEDLLAVVPVVLGFEPADSIVMLTIDARQAFHARVDLPPDRRGVPEVVDLLLEPAARHRARSVVLLLYTADDDVARAVVRRVRRGLPDGRGPVLVEALRVDGGRWFPLLRGRNGLAATGVAYDVSSHPFVVEAVWAGRVLHGSRADLAATLRPDPDGVRDVEAARVDRPDSTGWVAATLGEWVGRDEPPPADVVARLLASLVVPPVRDVAWVRVTRDAARDHVRFWEALVRRAPDDLVAHAASVLALCAWVAGDGALAWCAVDRAREGDPDHTLAALVADLLVAAVPPTDWEVVRHQVAPAS